MFPDGFPCFVLFLHPSFIATTIHKLAMMDRGAWSLEGVASLLMELGAALFALRSGSFAGHPCFSCPQQSLMFPTFVA